MPLLDQLGKQITDFSQKAAANTEALVKISKLNDSISSIRQRLPLQYRELGKAYYTLFGDGGGAQELQSFVDAINASFAEIAEYRREITKAKGTEQCQSCGTEIMVGSLFCSNCGAKIIREIPKDDTLKCPQCGASINTEDLFCMTCGADLHSDKIEKEE